jgi:arylsulfatase A-like enzyme
MGRQIWKSVGIAALFATTIPLYAQDRTSLPIEPAPFDGVIAENAVDSKPGTNRPVRAPENAPNIFLFMSDDVGFAMSSAFGGPVPTPNLERVARTGQRYNRFHTTGICSPTRASLLTGRNPHNVSTGFLTDLAANYPGYNAHFPRSTATIAQTLRMNGYSTAMFGKHHNVPQAEMTPAGPFDMWPTGLGFEYFYGIIGGDSNQWHPALFRGTTRLSDPSGPPELMDKRLADDALVWLHNQKAAAPDKPFFLYFAPNSTHAPLQAPADMIASFKGKFDQGWDKMREESFARQLAMGIIPPGTKLTPRPTEIPAWDSQSPKQMAYSKRAMEVAAAMLVYQDQQFGRVLDEMERMGELDHTLIALIIGDNGASGEGGPTGSTNELRSVTSGKEEGDDWLATSVATLGSDAAYPTYPVGWAWAMNTPLRWTKQYASMLGAVRNGMILNWPGHVARPGSVCARFGHVNDMAPTLLEAAGLPAPHTVNGITQKPFDGESLVSSLSDCQPDKPRTQYFELTGKFALYKDGWLASNDDARVPWKNAPPVGVSGPTTWRLYDLTRDFSQFDDVSAANPAKLSEMQTLWGDVAKSNGIFPLDHRMGAARGAFSPGPQKIFDYWGNGISIPGMQGPIFAGRSFSIDAEVRLDNSGASGAVMALGSKFGGWSLYLDKGRPAFAYRASAKPEDDIRIVAKAAVPKGMAKFRVELSAEGMGKGVHFALFSGETKLAEGRSDNVFFTPAGIGEALDTGRDTGALVTNYATPQGALEGEVRHLRISF